MRRRPSRIALFLFASTTAVPGIGAQATWAVDPMPLVRIRSSTPDGEPRFGGATWAARVGANEIALADGVDNTVRLFGFDGSERRRFGRAGRGPGEFRSIGWLSTCGTDSLYAWDILNARMNVIHPVAGPVRSWTNPALRGPMISACSRARDFAFRVRFRRNEETRPIANSATSNGIRYRFYRDTFDIQVADGEGRESWEADGAFRSESVSSNFPDGGFMAMPRVDAPVTSYAFLDDQLVIADPDSATVRFVGRDGRTISSFRLTGRGAPLSVVQHEAALQTLLRRSPAVVLDRWPVLARSVPRSEQRLAFHDLLVDARGFIWLMTSPPGAAATQLIVHRRDGSAIATVTIPASITLFEVGDDYLLGRVEDDEGEQQVVLYRFHRR